MSLELALLLYSSNVKLKGKSSRWHLKPPTQQDPLFIMTEHHPNAFLSSFNFHKWLVVQKVLSIRCDKQKMSKNDMQDERKDECYWRHRPKLTLIILFKSTLKMQEKGKKSRQWVLLIYLLRVSIKAKMTMDMLWEALKAHLRQGKQVSVNQYTKHCNYKWDGR